MLSKFWLSLLLSVIFWGCSHPVSRYEIPSPEPSAASSPERVPPCLSTPEPLVIYFTNPVSSCSLLFYYDEKCGDVYALPAAGRGVHSPQGAPRHSVVFERNFRIYRYFVCGDECLHYYDTGRGFAFAPYIDDDENLYVLVADRKQDAENGIGDILFVLNPDTCPVFCRLGAINAVGRGHGGITSFDVSSDGRVLAFTTLDGRLFLCDLVCHVPGPIMETQYFDAEDVDLDGAGRLVTWVDVEHNRILIAPTCFPADAWIPDIPIFPGAVVSSPRFKGSQPDYVTFRELFPDGCYRRFAYNFCLGITRTLTIIPPQCPDCLGCDACSSKRDPKPEESPL